MTVEKLEPTVTFVLKISLALILARKLLLVLLPPIHMPNSNLTECRVRVNVIYFFHFEITGGPCNLIDSHQRDLFTNRTIVCSKLYFFPSQRDSFSKTQQPIRFHGLFKVTDQIARKETPYIKIIYKPAHYWITKYLYWLKNVYLSG